GTYVPELSDTAIDGVTVTSLAAAAAERDDVLPEAANNDVVLALNTALAADGVVIRVAAGAAVARPIPLVCGHSAGPATAVFTRSRVVVEAGAQLTLVESHEGPDNLDYQINTALDLIVGRGAKVDHVKVTCEGNAALHVATLSSTVAEGAE